MSSRRTKSRKSATESPHDVYSLTCGCGETFTGERDTQPLILECPRCSELLYVLPRDVYPRPQVLEPEPELPEDTEDEADIPELTVLEIEDDGGRLAEPKDETPPRIWIDRPRGALVRKRILQVAGLIVALLLATWWGISRRAQRTAAESTFYAQSEAAWEFVSKARWDDAHEAAELAVEAADYLGRDDPASEEIRDLRDELAILLRLSSQSLIEIVLQKQAEEPDPAQWESLFSARHAGYWLLLEGVIVREVTEQETRYRFEYPASLPGQNVELVWDGPVDAFENLDWQDERYEAFLAVRMMGVRVQESDPDSWSIILSSDEVRFWTIPALLTEALGVDLYSEDATALRELVESQIPADRVKHENLQQNDQQAETTSDSRPGEEP